MKDIPAGTLTMGSDSAADHGARPPHQVTFSAFKMSETDVTQEQYRAVIDSNQSYFDKLTTFIAQAGRPGKFRSMRSDFAIP